MKLLIIKIDTSQEVEDALSIYAMDNLNVSKSINRKDYGISIT